MSIVERGGETIQPFSRCQCLPGRFVLCAGFLGICGQSPYLPSWEEALIDLRHPRALRPQRLWARPCRAQRITNESEAGRGKRSGCQHLRNQKKGKLIEEKEAGCQKYVVNGLRPSIHTRVNHWNPTKVVFPGIIFLRVGREYNPGKLDSALKLISTYTLKPTRRHRRT